MVKAQEWLDKNYPKENRKNVKEIKVESTSEIVTWIIGERSGFQKLEGSLNLTDFPNLERLCLPDNNLTSLDCSQNFKLRVLDCSGNKLTELNVNACLELKALDCSKNFLTKLVTEYNHELEELDISNNNFPAQDLSFLSHLVNLKGLEVGNWGENLNPNLYNHFSGSLEPLKNLTKLEELDIDNTDLDSGLEYLPFSLKWFSCPADQRENAKVKKLETELKNFGEVGEDEEFIHSLQEWRKANCEFIFDTLQKTIEELKEKNAELEVELQMECEEAAKALEKAKEWRERQLKEITEQKDRKIQELKTQLEKLQLQAQIQVSPQRTSN